MRSKTEYMAAARKNRGAGSSAVQHAPTKPMHAPPPTGPRPTTAHQPVFAPAPTKPKPQPVKPNPPRTSGATKPSMAGRVGAGLTSGAALLGAGALFSASPNGGGVGGIFGLGSQAIGAAAGASVANHAVDATADVLKSVTGNPVNLAIVAGVAVGGLYLMNKRP